MKREKGSAIILAILILSFFMALSMNMFYISRQKANKATIKIKGNKVLSKIDVGASLGALEYATAILYEQPGVLDDVNNSNLDILLNRYGEYFIGRIDTTTYANGGANYDIALHHFEDNRNNSTGTTVADGIPDNTITKRICEEASTKLSIGLYDYTTNAAITYPASTNNYTINYKKEVIIPGDGGNIKDMVFEIVYTENINTDASKKISAYNPGTITVTYQN
ncbi:hypothetical protein [Haliovirga abyssi]|uniref:Type 4 fimbrial biogenesis protein PilX N-terminal domain-containing protein n=1 Tax=Haliovirga abyssi TaxID=2996794 RepID=A0AAU9D0T8_9FUSO|nr:hypothetical protein [Haliovirga abyssi]BDU49579.1 hypothetical protein HLVA_01480 [Haliovirga abyssi]